uniref:Uncharacterized protein n=1 Tax=Oryza nivara TaxID=4536 RepID=A0A0E0FIM2_ORYNI
MASAARRERGGVPGNTCPCLDVTCHVQVPGIRIQRFLASSVRYAKCNKYITVIDQLYHVLYRAETRSPAITSLPVGVHVDINAVKKEQRCRRSRMLPLAFRKLAEENKESPTAIVLETTQTAVRKGGRKRMPQSNRKELQRSLRLPQTTPTVYHSHKSSKIRMGRSSKSFVPLKGYVSEKIFTL